MDRTHSVDTIFLSFNANLPWKPSIGPPWVESEKKCRFVRPQFQFLLGQPLILSPGSKSLVVGLKNSFY
jgi:hypothetical protein